MSKQDQCKIGYSCGEACINTDYECKTEQASQDFSSLADNYAKKASGPKSLKHKLSPEDMAKMRERLRRPVLPRDNTNVLDWIVKPFSDEEAKELEALAESRRFKAKTDHAQSVNANLTRIEALGMGAWVSEYYSMITNAIMPNTAEDMYFASDVDVSADQAKLLARALYQSLNKQANLSPDKVREQAQSEAMQGRDRLQYHETFAKALQKNKPYSLHRGMQNIKDAKYTKLLDTYKEGAEVAFDSFTASSFDKTRAESFGKQVIMRITPKSDKSAGKLVDEYKYRVNENEVLFPPGTKMRVDKVVNRAKEDAEKLKPMIAELNLPEETKQAFYEYLDEYADVFSNTMTTPQLREAKLNAMMAKLSIYDIQNKADKANAKVYRKLIPFFDAQFGLAPHEIWLTEL